MDNYWQNCPVCGGRIYGDGFSVVWHCENLDGPFFVEPDSAPLFCDAPVGADGYQGGNVVLIV